MDDDLRHVVAGAALGAVSGAVVGLVYSRLSSGRRRGGGDNKRDSDRLDGRSVIRLVMSIARVVRQVLELS